MNANGLGLVREIDLIHENWSVEDFELNHIYVSKEANKISLVAEKALNEDATGRFGLSNWVGMVHNWGSKILGYAASNNLFIVTEAINQKALSYIHELSDSIEFSPLIPDKIARARQIIAELGVLRQNLLSHDAYIAKCNQLLFFKEKSFAACPDHIVILRRVEEAIEEANGYIVKKSSEQAQKFLDEAFIKLKTQIKNGQLIDCHFISTRYPEFDVEIQKLYPKSVRKKYGLRFNQVINRAYLEGLIHQTESGKMPLPLTIQKGFLAFGYTQEELDAVLEEGKAKFIMSFQDLRDLDRIFSSSLEILNFVQTQVIVMTASLLKDKRINEPLSLAQRQQLITVFHMIRKFELSLNSLCQSYFSAGLESVLQTLPDDTSDELIAFYREELQKMPIEENIGSLVGLFLDFDVAQPLKGSLWTLKQEQFEKLTQEMDKEASIFLDVFVGLPDSKKIFDQDFMIQLNALKLQPYLDWIKNNQSHCLIRFNQYEWGYDEVLEEGLCFAITYGWLKEMQKHPNKKIQSLQDLGIVVGSSGAPQLAIHRFIQASYSVSVRTKQIHEEDLPDLLKKKDKVQVNALSIPPQKQVGDLIKEIERLDKEGEIYLSDSAGVVKIGAYDDTRGHALFVRLNHFQEEYLFGDVNEGIWRYSSSADMSTAFEQYLKIKYPGQRHFKTFTASQYLFE